MDTIVEKPLLIKFCMLDTIGRIYSRELMPMPENAKSVKLLQEDKRN